MRNFLIEYLPRKLIGLLKDHTSIFRISIVAKVCPLIDKAPPARIDHNSKWITMLLKTIADREIAELRRVAIPSDGMASRPVTVRHRADLECHPNPITSVETRAAHFRQIPSGTQVTGAPFDVGLEAARRQYDRAPFDCQRPPALVNHYAAYAVVVMYKRERPARVRDFDSIALGQLVERLDQARTTAPCLDRKPAPELEAAIDLERLPPINRHEAYAFLAHPLHRRKAARYQRLGQRRRGAILRHPAQVIIKLIFAVNAEIGRGFFFVSQIRHHANEVIDAVIRHAHRTCGKGTVATAFLNRRTFEH